MNIKMLKMAFAGLALGISGFANAALISVATQAEFDVAGDIAQVTNWDSYGSGFERVASPFLVGNLTFIAGGSNVIGGISDYRFARSLFSDNNILGTTMNIANTFNLLAFNAGNFLLNGNALFEITTNVSSYSFIRNVNSYASGGTLSFFGIQATGGEYFTSLSWSGDNATGLTDIQLGTAAEVPEPSTLAIFALGLMGLASRRFMKKS
jgi:hypothetical protein